MKIKLLLDIIEKFLPRETAMEGDRIGLQIQAGRDDVQKILITMEVNDLVIEEAQKLNADCIITFHPLIFYPLTQVVNNERVGRLLSKLIKNDISLISIHTNFDSYENGTNKILSDKLGLIFESFLIEDKIYEGHGMGAICRPKDDINLNQLLQRVSEICNSPLRYCYGKNNDRIRKIAIVGGSGSSFIAEAVQAGVDAFITADVSYHQFHKVEGEMALIDPGHYEMEQFVAQGLYDLLSMHIKNDIELIISKSYTNPVRYYPDFNFTEKQKEYIIK